MNEDFWLIVGMLSGAVAMLLTIGLCYYSRSLDLRAARRRFRPGSYVAFKRALIFSVDNYMGTMFYCGGQVMAPPRLHGWRIVVPVTMDPDRKLGPFDSKRYTVPPPPHGDGLYMPDVEVFVTNIRPCSRDDFDRLDCDLESYVVYTRPPRRLKDESDVDRIYKE